MLMHGCRAGGCCVDATEIIENNFKSPGTSWWLPCPMGMGWGMAPNQRRPGGIRVMEMDMFDIYMGSQLVFRQDGTWETAYNRALQIWDAFPHDGGAFPNGDAVVTVKQDGVVVATIDYVTHER